AATGLSLFSLHMDACNGVLPPPVPPPGRYAARKILFAERNFTVREDLSPFAPRVTDIPWPGTTFEEGQAVVSVLGTGCDREGAMEDLVNTLNKLERYMRG
ncbi:MAG TPA: ATP-dependent carboligase, partial [Methanomicrobiales archaeon]|nr:ATP-dependent carboligase [Methanomicrobiales archaeon]